MARLCRLLIFIVIVAVPFRNVFTAVLPESVGLLAKELILAVCCYIAVQLLILNRGYRLKLGDWLRTMDVQVVLLFGVYVLVLCVISLTRSMTQAFLGVAVYLSYTLLFGLTLLFLSGKDIEAILRKVVFYVYPIVSVGALLSLVSGFSLVATQEVAYLGSADHELADAFRATSFTGSSLHLGLYNAMILPLVFAYLVHRDDENWKTRLWLIGVFLLGMISLVVSFSRGAWVQSFIGVAVVAMICRKKMARHVAVWVVLGVVCVVFLIVHKDALSLYWQRFTSITDWAGSSGNVGRIQTWNLCFGKFVDSGFLGYGPAATGNAAARLNLGEVATITESSYLKLLLELGIVGFALFAVVYYRFTARSARLIGMMREHKSGWLAIGIFGSLVGLGIEMAIYQSIETQVVQALLWFYLAAVAVIYRESYIK